MNSLLYKNLKEIDRHIFFLNGFKPTIWDHCQMTVNWNSHYQKLHKKKASFRLITHRLLIFIKRPVKYWKTFKYVLINDVRIVQFRKSACGWLILAEICQLKASTKKLHYSNLHQIQQDDSWYLVIIICKNIK